MPPPANTPLRRLTLVPLCAATYFMVSGGPYGLEELIGRAGYPLALVAIVITPLLWSLPTALMVGELAAALPDEGGYYAWVRRALGPFWGFQEAWLSLAASVFDMAIYPTLFVHYLGHLWPALHQARFGAIVCGAAMIAACTLWNLRGSRSVGWGSVGLTLLLLSPFVVFTICALVGSPSGAPLPPSSGNGQGMLGGMIGALTIAMWNFMGWDNASTIAGEVDRPQRTYPLALLCTLGLVAITYAIPILASWRRGLDPSGWDTGAWVAAGFSVGGSALGGAMSVGGMVCAVGMFSALMLSYSRVPAVLAKEGLLPRALAIRSPRTDAPTVAIVVCAIAYTACLGLGFDRLVELDVALYGASLLLEFVALAVLRVREPKLERPFVVPGGTIGAFVVGIPPMAMVVLALAWAGHDQGNNARTPLWMWSTLIGVLGAPLYLLAHRRR